MHEVELCVFGLYCLLNITFTHCWYIVFVSKYTGFTSFLSMLSWHYKCSCSPCEILGFCCSIAEVLDHLDICQWVIHCQHFRTVCCFILKGSECYEFCLYPALDYLLMPLNSASGVKSLQ